MNNSSEELSKKVMELELALLEMGFEKAKENEEEMKEVMLRLLPEVQLKALFLRFSGFSVAEISDILNVSQGSVHRYFGEAFDILLFPQYEVEGNKGEAVDILYFSYIVKIISNDFPEFMVEADSKKRIRQRKPKQHKRPKITYLPLLIFEPDADYEVNRVFKRKHGLI